MLRNNFWASELLNRFPEVSHGFVSAPLSFNLSLNFKNMMSAILFYRFTKIPFRNWVFAEQIHGDSFHYIDDKKNLIFPKIVHKTDALLTSEKGRIIVMFFADCFPIYVYSPKIPLVGLIHSGWRGALKRLPFKVLQEILTRYDLHPNEIYLAVGPGIQNCCFQVKEDFIEKLSEEDKKYLEERENSFYFDLPSFITSQFWDLNIPKENVDLSGICTKCNLNFYSYRRDKTKDRNIGFIYIRRG